MAERLASDRGRLYRLRGKGKTRLCIRKTVQRAADTSPYCFSLYEEATGRAVAEDISVPADGCWVELYGLPEGVYRLEERYVQADKDVSMQADGISLPLSYDPVRRVHTAQLEAVGEPAIELSSCSVRRARREGTLVIHNFLGGGEAQTAEYFLTDSRGEHICRNGLCAVSGGVQKLEEVPGGRYRLYLGSPEYIFDYAYINLTDAAVHWDYGRGLPYIPIDMDSQCQMGCLQAHLFGAARSDLLTTRLRFCLDKGRFLSGETVEFLLSGDALEERSLSFSETDQCRCLDLVPSEYTVRLQSTEQYRFYGALINRRFVRAVGEEGQEEICFRNFNVFRQTEILLLAESKGAEPAASLSITAILPCGGEDQSFSYRLLSVDGKTVYAAGLKASECFPAGAEGIAPGVYRLQQDADAGYTLFNFLVNGAAAEIQWDEEAGEYYAVIAVTGRQTEVAAYYCSRVDYETTGQMFLHLCLAGHALEQKDFSFRLVHSDGVSQSRLTVTANGEALMVSPVVIGAYRLYQEKTSGYVLAAAEVNERAACVQHDPATGERYVMLYLTKENPILRVEMTEVKCLIE